MNDNVRYRHALFLITINVFLLFFLLRSKGFESATVFAHFQTGMRNNPSFFRYVRVLIAHKWML